MAPLCSNTAVNPNRIMICGKNTKMPANPASTPSIRRLRHQVSGSALDRASIPVAIQPSSRSVGTVAQL